MDSIWFTFILSSCVVFLCILKTFISWTFSDVRSHKYFFVKPLPFIGTLPHFIKWKTLHGFGDMHTYLKEKYGNVYGDVLSTDVVLTIHDSDILRHILFSDFNNFRNRKDAPFQGLLTKSLLFVQDDVWRRQRKLLTPAFASGKLKEIIPTIDECATTTVNLLKKKAISGQSLEMKAFNGGFTMDVIASSQFGLNVDAQTSENNPFIKHGKDITESMRSSNWKSSFRIFFPTLSWLIELIVGYRIAEHSYETVLFFQKTVKSILLMDNDKNMKPSILSILKNSQKNENSLDKTSKSKYDLKDDEITSNASLFIAAGYDTTANTLSFLFYHLAIHPEIQDKIVEEIHSVFGNEMTITAERIAQMKYLESCIDETLRIYPPVPLTSRVAVSDCKYKDVEIKSGWSVHVPIRAIHMDSEKWPEPHLFKPERFSPESRPHIDATHFLPFGAGPRQCIGVRLAYLEMKILVVKLLQEIQFTKCEKTEVPIKIDPDPILITSLNGIWLNAKLRDENLK